MKVEKFQLGLFNPTQPLNCVYSCHTFDIHSYNYFRYMVYYVAYVYVVNNTRTTTNNNSTNKKLIT